MQLAYFPRSSVDVTETDAGEPGNNDSVHIVIKDANGVPVLSVSDKVSHGNNQAH